MEGRAPFVPHGLDDNEGVLRSLSMGWATPMLERNKVTVSLSPVSSYGYLLRMTAISFDRWGQSEKRAT